MAACHPNFFTSGVVPKILIYDGDGHFGNGCVDIMQQFPSDFSHVTYMGESYGINKDKPVSQIADIDFSQYGLVLYQAGADAHEDDPYGVGYLSTSKFVTRDHLMFSRMNRAGVPYVWNLAGGYNGQRTIKLHAMTWENYVSAAHMHTLVQVRP
jgi:acetoin utilization deacetylase AcuC-like enzyme